jgi:hypothetical protein
MSSVGSSESIVNVNVTELGEVVSERLNGFFGALDFVSLVVFVFSLFFSVESNIFAKENFVIGSVDLINNAVTNTVI